MSHTNFVGTLDDLIADLRSADVQERIDAAWALSTMGRDALKALPALIDALSDDEEKVIILVCDSLRHLTPESKIAIPTLEKLVKSTKQAAAKEAEKTLLFFENPEAYRKTFAVNRWLLFSVLSIVLMVGVSALMLILRWLQF